MVLGNLFGVAGEALLTFIKEDSGSPVPLLGINQIDVDNFQNRNKFIGLRLEAWVRIIDGIQSNNQRGQAVVNYSDGLELEIRNHRPSHTTSECFVSQSRSFPHSI